MSELGEARALLIQELQLALAEFEKNERYGSAAAIHAVSVFLLLALDIDPRLTAPLLSAIGQIEGTARGSSIKRIDEALILGTLAAYVELVKRAGMPLEVACQRVITASGSNIDKNQLREFRKNLGRRRARTEAMEAYSSTLVQLTQVLDHLPSEPADIRIAAIEAAAKQLTLPKKG